MESTTPATLEAHLLSLIDKLFPMALPLNTTKLFQALTDAHMASVDTGAYDRRDARSSHRVSSQTPAVPSVTFGTTQFS